MDLKRLGVLVVIGVGLGIVFGLSKKESDEKADRQHNEELKQEITPAPVQHDEPAEHDPTYVEPHDDNPKQRELVNRAMRIVYANCSEYAVFREGSTLEGNTVDGGENPPRVNVTVKLARPKVADGNVLWYMVTFDRAGLKMRAVKRVSAELCGFNAPDVDAPARE